MADINFPFGYCSNVHAGPTLAQAKANLLKFSSAVRARVNPDGNLPVGLWLAENAADSLIEQNEVFGFRDWLVHNRFTPYTLNGFPQGDFHQPVVKHAVYEPTWTCDSRTRYTLCLAEILDVILPEGATGSISTLPLGWPYAPWHAENFKCAADNLLEVARFLKRLSHASGKEVVIAIEPEPGCVLDSALEVVEFFEHYLLRGSDAETARRHLTVCHDICHSGVMFEPQQEALSLYLKHGIRIGKVQVSSAVHVPWDKCLSDPTAQAATLAQLQTFDEPKYLHQTTRRGNASNATQLAQDLPDALKHWLIADEYPSTAWRIHFHVPIFVDAFGRLESTRADIGIATQFLEQHRCERIADRAWFTGHYEVETYAWPVLPKELAVEDLADGIAMEMEYFSGVLQQCRPS